ncbi:MAG: 13E12 repeat family protein, partial [Actinomycetota bacterium]|nr:13E12 repeat family protein [Actinomycetota bacterium]
MFDEVDDALERLDRALGALAVDGFDAATLTSAGRRAARGRATLDRFDAVLARRAKRLAAAGTVRDATAVLDPDGQRASGDVDAARRRAAAIADSPPLGDAFERGGLPAAHLDVIARARRALRGEMLRRFDAEQDDLLIAAGRQPLSAFRRTVTRLVEGLHADAGADRNQRLHHRRSLRRWWDDDGMRHWHLSIDTAAAARIDGALDAQVEALFHRDRDDGDTHRTSDQLACDALGELVAGGHAATRPGRAEISVIVDYDTLVNGLHDRSIHVDNNGQPITPDAIRRLACDADILPIVLAGGTVPLDMGRRVRTATHEQRLALAAIYPGCAISDCQVRFANCEVHHT